MRTLCAISHFGANTLCFAKKSGIVLVEMADRAGSGSTEFHIELEGHGAECSRLKLYG